MLVGMLGPLAKVKSLTVKKVAEAGIFNKSTVDIRRYGASLPSNAWKNGIAYSRLLTKEFEQLFIRYDLWLTPTILI